MNFEHNHDIIISQKDYVALLKLAHAVLTGLESTIRTPCRPNLVPSSNPTYLWDELYMYLDDLPLDLIVIANRVCTVDNIGIITLTTAQPLDDRGLQFIFTKPQT